MQSYEINKTTFKRHAISAFVTFSSAMAMVLITELDNLTLEAIQTGAWVGIVIAVLRAGLKAFLEWYVSFAQKR